MNRENEGCTRVNKRESREDVKSIEIEYERSKGTEEEWKVRI